MVMLHRHVVVQYLIRQASEANGFLGPTDLRFRTHEDTDLVRQDSCVSTFGKPSPDDGAFFLCIFQHLSPRRRTIKSRYGITAIFGEAVTEIDRSRKQVVTALGRRFAYDKLVLATGSFCLNAALAGPRRCATMVHQSSLVIP